MARARVLVVDDQVGMLRAVEKTLGNLYDVHAFTSPLEALRALDGFTPTLAIVDISMPGMDGFELMGELKLRCPDVDVILMTGSIDETDARLIQAIQAEAYYFITKPFPAEVLLTLVNRCVEQRRMATALAEHAELMKRELTDAQAFQRCMMPSGVGKTNTFGVRAYYQPQRQLGGDFYDYVALGKTDFALLIADVMGKGAGAAMLTSMIKLAFHSAATDDYLPAVVVRRMLRSIPLLASDRYATVLCIRLRGAIGTLEYVNAGHPAGLLLRRGGELVELASTGPPVHAELPELGWEQRSIQVAPGDRLFLYTDGATDALSPDDHMFGEERLIAAVRGAARDGTSAIDAVLHSLEAFVRGRPASDDVTLLEGEFFKPQV